MNGEEVILKRVNLIYLVIFVLSVSTGLIVHGNQSLIGSLEPEEGLLDNSQVSRPNISYPDLSKEIDRKPPTIFVMMESTRNDHITCYGYRRNTSPNLCGLADDGVLFERAYSQSSQTSSSVPSMMTGLPPSVTNTDFRTPLSQDFLLFTEVLNKKGYSLKTNPRPEIAELGFYQGIEHRDKPTAKLLPEENRSVFVLEFLVYPHSPYRPDEEYRRWDNVSFTSEEIGDKWEKGEWESFTRNRSEKELRNLYDAEILQADAGLGRLISKLKSKGIYEDSLIIVTSDHGEVFQENSHGVKGFHGGKPYENVLQVPLVIKFPKNKFSGKNVEQPVRLIDLPATILDYIGMTDHYGVGTSLLPAINGQDLNLPVFASSESPRGEWMYGRKDFRLIVENAKECKDSKDFTNPEIYYLPEDPNQENPHFSVYGRVRSFIYGPTRSDLSKELCSFFNINASSGSKSEKLNMSKNVRKRLKKLGYLN